MSVDIDKLAKPLKVIQRIQETDEAVSLVLEIPSEQKDRFHYQAGQFVTFFLNIQGEQISRSYSLSTSPLVDKEFKVTVKKVPGGRGSTFLCEKVKVGDQLMTTPPSGQFFKPSLESKGVHYFLFAAGSGITPVFSVMKTVLTASPLNRVTMVYCNRRENAIIYAQELKLWEQKHPNQLNVVHVLSKPSPDWPGRSGRLNRQLIDEILEMPNEMEQEREYYLCGPAEFMNAVRLALVESGVANEQIREENFGVAVHKPHAIHESWTRIGPHPEREGEAPEKIIATINGEIVEVAAKEGMAILETLLEAGAQPPYSCMDGACMACMAKITEGRVYQEDPGILAEDNIENHEALTCQAKPLARIVRVSYDDL